MKVEAAYDNIVDIATKKYHRSSTKHFSYGTAGFRDRSEVLDWIMFRMGILAALRSKAREAAFVGVMVTASHNPVQDNGVKIIDPDGEMMAADWETDATNIANCIDEDLPAVIDGILSSHNIDFAMQANVFVAMDTRPSSECLSEAVKAGVEAIGGKHNDFGLLTTPQLHYITSLKNSDPATSSEQGEAAYYDKLKCGFQKICNPISDLKNYESVLNLDCANGVGALKLEKMLDFWPVAPANLKISILNNGISGVLNEKCGADHVKTNQTFPQNFDSIRRNAKCAAFDGDADRIIYFFRGSEKFVMLDGDKIASLFAKFIYERLKICQLELKFGVIQTAYANGASTNFLRKKMNIPVECALTGVKHLHEKAKQYDISVYFEANGHGTILFSKTASRKLLEFSARKANSEEESRAIQDLCNIEMLINQTTGDAISDLLVVEAILQSYDWSVSHWANMYTEYPNRLMKVRVSDRKVITTKDCERQCVTPLGLQEEINKIVEGVTNGRSFVRPSGTEDVVRVYAEASSQESADKLAIDVAQIVFKMAGGVGDEPKG